MAATDQSPERHKSPCHAGAIHKWTPIGGQTWTPIDSSANSSFPGREVTGRTTHIRDGDTIEVQGIPVRLAKLDCAETGTAQGAVATRRMRELADGQEMACNLTGRKSYDRWIGECAVKGGRDVGEVMLEEGVCKRY